MRNVSVVRRFLGSRSGRGFLVHLALCATLSAAVGLGFFYFSVNWFKEHKSEEKFIALRLVDAFVTDYSAIRAQFGTTAPVPATFRAHAIEAFNKGRATSNDFRLQWVGREGRQILTGPSDQQMAKTIEDFVGAKNPQPHAELLTVDGQLVFRTVYPSFAKEQSCVDCHNSLQPNANWKLNELMGAFAIDVPAGPFLSTIRLQSGGLALALFLALGIAGFIFSYQHFRQMSEREAANAELGGMRTFLDTVIENMPAILSVKDARKQAYIRVNRAASRLFGYSQEAMVGKTPHDLFPKAQADFFEAGDNEAMAQRGAPVVYEHTVTAPHIGTRVLNTKKMTIKGDDGEPHYLVSVSEDITERKRAEAQIHHMAHHDGLTDLPNRVAFSEKLSEMLARAKESGETFAVLCLDLDRFKEINDVFGHSIGDGLLQEVARRFRSVSRGDFLARFGGDEFTFITATGAQPETAAALAKRLHEALSTDLEVMGHTLRTGLSIGIACYPVDGSDETTLIGNADAALYRAKAEGRGKTQFFEIAMDQRLRERRALQTELRMAVARGELSLHYQPLSRVNGEVVGLEALCRWNNPGRGNIPPGVFIPLAEETGLIMTIGEWTLREACREAASWPKPLNLAVNLSPIQFRHGDLVGLVHSVLLETGLSPNRLELEITEGVLVEDFERGVSILRRLKALGVRIAMDDFGTGYSSLSYLQAFPFDKIKIDRSFISNVNSNAQSAAIVRSVVGLAQGLKLPVLAEGVETSEQLAFLAREHCDEVQGYLFGRPMAIDAYAEIVGRAPSKDQALVSA
jgi:diguanylate cyclase (GGDEF)-like protein/PAS domain S-box-containing protein